MSCKLQNWARNGMAGLLNVDGRDTPHMVIEADIKEAKWCAGAIRTKGNKVQVKVALGFDFGWVEVLS
eukprot:2666243-Ditylum_brightwellii.AAC.1